ncbi:hypothetical protein [Lentzea nigeriaca]|uniref:hypothetical protein n=1 Tax=Lentzea nigeriaca TaxID=1128665 RepID=UPI001957FBAC|nr:hypothetical protein [Lentzea nigeriaca]MBM7863892.1 hypothetical protein [Lentzea nigeriaca]
MIELDDTERDVVIKINREGGAEVIKSAEPEALSAGPAAAAPAALAEDGGTTDAGPAPENH